MTNDCPICLSAYTSKTRKKITCQYCPATACLSCQQTSILSVNAEPACFDCKREWNTEFMSDTFGVTFRTKTLRVHRRKIVCERERALLPSMQAFVEMRRRMIHLQEEFTSIQPIFIACSTKYNELRQNMMTSKNIYQSMFAKTQIGPLSAEETETMRISKENFTKYTLDLQTYRTEQFMPSFAKYNRISGDLNRLTWRYRTGAQEGEKKERREFIMRCPAADCRGFLSTGYKCGTCSKKTCSECTEIIEEGQEHTCKPESVESTKAIKKETRPCPKCAAPIYKIDGCDQMWCTNGGCNTAFSWNTGQVVTGRVHNPHYYEWMRRQGGGEAPREMGDIPCGGIPGFQNFSQPFYSKYTLITSRVRTAIFEIHRHTVEIEGALPSYPQQMPALMNKDTDVEYLMNRIDEETWVRNLEHADVKFQRRREIGQILHTLVTATADTLREIHMRMVEEGTRPEIPGWIENEVLPTLEALRSYTNDTFRKFGAANRCAVPQISERWGLLAPRVLYRAAAAAATATAAAATNTVV